MRSKIKQTGSIVLIVLVGLLIASVFFFSNNTENMTAAAYSNESRPWFDYTYRTGTNLTIISPLTIKETQVQKSKQLVYGVEESCEVYFEISSDERHASSENIVFSRTIMINAVSKFTNHHFVVSDMQGSILMSSDDNEIKVTLEKCKYFVTYTGISTWDEELDPSIIHRKAQVDCSFYLYLDQDIASHDYILTEFPATCTEEGYSLYECSVCGDKYKDNIIPALGHQFVYSTVNPTCTSEGKSVATCENCGFVQEFSNGSLPRGHSFTSVVVRAASCTDTGQRHFVCDQCGFEYDELIQAKGHSYSITKVSQSDGKTTRTYTCSVCGDSYTQELGNQYEQVTNYVEYLFQQYSPYMYWVLLATAGLWSIAIGVAIIIATKNDDKAKAKKMLVNYIIGLVIIFAIVVACPYLVRGIAAFVT